MKDEERTNPGTPNVLQEIRACLEESRALNKRLETVLETLSVDLDFRREIRRSVLELSERVDEIEKVAR